MGSFRWRDSRFIYEEQGGVKVLLDCTDFLANKSRISMHRLPGYDALPIIPDLIGRALDEMGREDETKLSAAALLDTLLVRYLIRSSQPLHLLEYGCQDGVLSAQMAGLIGAFNEDSSFVCAYDAMETGWLERISKVEKLPKISYLAGDFGHLQLRQRYFDIVVINGSVNYTCPLAVLEDALDLVTEEGVILCYVDHTPLLESTFKLFFEEREEYTVSATEKVLLAKAGDRCWRSAKKSDLEIQIGEHLSAAEGILECGDKEGPQIAVLIESLRQDGKRAAQQGLVELKKQILEQKEQLIALRVSL